MLAAPPPRVNIPKPSGRAALSNTKENGSSGSGEKLSVKIVSNPGCVMPIVYGRGRALPPYIGKGIVYDNLVEVADFITSACSCTVKDQNPGVDLLMSFDWDSASAAVAERFGSEEGNNETLDDLFPQLIFPGGQAPSQDEKDSVKDEK